MSHFEHIFSAYMIAFSSLTLLMLVTVFKHRRMKRKMAELSRILDKMQSNQ